MEVDWNWMKWRKKKKQIKKETYVGVFLLTNVSHDCHVLDFCSFVMLPLEQETFIIIIFNDFFNEDRLQQ